MGRIARRFDHDAGEIDPGRPAVFAGKHSADVVHARKHGGKQVLGCRFVGHCSDTWAAA
jgi:hypothetical protein